MIKKRSFFKNPSKDQAVFKQWISKLELMNGYEYEKFSITTSLGKTQIYGLNTTADATETILIFPGFRTTTLIWDLDQGLLALSQKYRVFLIETNGQPNLSDGNSPSIKSLDYGKWGAEVFDQLGIESAYIAGASFGGLVCMKIALVIPDKIKGAFLLNPGCFRMVSLGLKNLYYNLLPIVKTTNENIQRFLEEIIFCKPEHQLSPKGEALLVEYLKFGISTYKDKTEKPYYMGKQLDDVQVDTYLLVGANDILLPIEKSIANAKKHLGKYLKEVKVFDQVGHGIECYPPCLNYIINTIESN